jgi:RimJ/RimL family protein N-acetyltransferase
MARMKTTDGSRLATRLIALRPPEGNEATLLREMTRSGLLRRVSPTLEPSTFAVGNDAADNERPPPRGAITFVIVALGDDETLGFTSLLPTHDAPGRGTLGPIWARSEANAAVIARDATFLLMQFGFETERYRRLELMTEAQARTGRAQLVQLGFRREGILRSFDCRTGGNRATSPSGA